MEYAMAAAELAYSDGVVTRLPDNNPGFDILIQQRAGTVYVEVKGTTSSSPRFFMSEGEREFSETHPDEYVLWIVYGIDLVTRTGRMAVREGPISGMDVRLRPTQWYGEVVPARFEDRGGEK